MLQASARGRLSARLQAAAVFFLGLALLALFFRGADFAAIGASLARAEPRLIGLAVAITLLTYLVRALRWRYLLAPIGRARLGPLFVTTVIGFMVNFLLPPGRLGEIARPYLLARREGFSTSSALATVFLERLLDVLAVVFLVGSWLLAGSAPAGARSQSAVYGLKIGGLAGAAGAGLVLVAVAAFVRHRERAMSWVERVVRRLPQRMEGALLRFVEAFGKGLAVVTDRGNLALAGALSLLLWLNISLAFWLGARAFAIEMPFGAAFLVIGFLTVGVAVPTPGAVGGYHVMCALALTLLFGVEENLAKAAALVNHAIAFVPVSLLGMILFAREGLTLRDVKQIAAGPD